MKLKILRHALAYFLRHLARSNALKGWQRGAILLIARLVVS